MATKKEIVKVFEWLLDGKEVESKLNLEEDKCWGGLSLNTFIEDLKDGQDYHGCIDYLRSMKYRIKPQNEWRVNQEVWITTMYGIKKSYVVEISPTYVRVDFHIDGDIEKNWFNHDGTYQDEEQIVLFDHPIKIVKHEKQENKKTNN